MQFAKLTYNMRKNKSQKIFKCKTPLQRVSLMRRFPSDFFKPKTGYSQNDKQNQFLQKKCSLQSNPNDEQVLINVTNNKVKEAQNSYQFTFYRSNSSDIKNGKLESIQKISSKKEVFKKFNIKLPHIHKPSDADFCHEQTSKLQKKKIKFKNQMFRKQNEIALTGYVRTNRLNLHKDQIQKALVETIQ